MRITVLDGFSSKSGNLEWTKISSIGELTGYEKTESKDIIKRSKESEILLTNKTVLNKDTLLKLPKLKYIGVLATGYNVVDLKQTALQNIIVTNIPAYSTSSVAQLVFAHILNITNRVALHSKSVRQGDWCSSKYFTYNLTPQTEIANKTMGIVGLGNIGMKTAEIANAFDMKVIALTSKKELPSFIKSVTKNELFRESDFLSLHCPLTSDTENFINKETLSLMKKTSVLINTGRGPLVNETDLSYALNNNIIAAAGLDVLSKEPADKNNPLLRAKNCFITPHIAWATSEAKTRLLNIAYNNIKNFMEGHPINIVHA